MAIDPNSNAALEVSDKTEYMHYLKTAPIAEFAAYAGIDIDEAVNRRVAAAIVDAAIKENTPMDITVRPIEPQGNLYGFRCRKRADRKSCEGCGTLHVKEVEHFIYDEMCRKMQEFKTLTDSNPAKANAKLTALKTELAQVETEVEKLLNTLTGANTALISLANQKADELETKRQSLVKAIADMTTGVISPNKLNQISGYLNDWANVDTADRRFVVDGLIHQIKITSDNVKIEWKI